MEISKTATGYVVTDQQNDGAFFLFEFKKLFEDRESIYAWLEVRMLHPAKRGELLLYVGRVNLTAPSSKQAIHKYVRSSAGAIVENYPFESIFELACQSVLKMYFAPKEPVRIEPIQNPRVDFLLYPLLPKGHPTLWYAPGGSGKSLLAMYVALLVKNGVSIDPEQTLEPCEVLYLDWEVDLHEARRRFTMIANGSFDSPSSIEFPLYMRCTLPLKDEFESIITAIERNDVKFVIVDSVAPACGGDINEASKVIEFFNFVRQITSQDVTILLITHVSKQHKEKEDGAMPIGSVFFENFPRLTWEIKHESEEHAINFALFPRKSNFGALPSIGFKACFDFGVITFLKIEAETVVTTKDKTMVEVLLNALRAHEEEVGVEELVKETGITRENIWKLLSKLKSKGLVINTERGKWKAVRKEEIGVEEVKRA
ncbi:MAG: AAA family ATPase [Thermofilaceae archaeon]